MNRLFRDGYSAIDVCRRCAGVLRLIPLFTLFAVPGIALGNDEHASIVPMAKQSLFLSISSYRDLIVAVGERGHIFYSNDGANWRQARVPTRSTLTGVSMLDDSTGWAVGHDAIILKTDDGAKTWTKVHSDIELDAPLLDVLFLDANHGIAIGAYGLYLLTKNGGASWLRSEFDDLLKTEASSNGEMGGEDFFDIHLNDIAISGNGTLYIAAEAGNIFQSMDRGATWSAISSPYHGSFFGILPTWDDTLFVFGLRGHLYRSTDAGGSWQKIRTTTNEMLSSGIRVENDIIISATGGVYLISRDHGRTFQTYTLEERLGIASIAAANGGLIFIGEFGIKNLNRPEILPADP